MSATLDVVIVPIVEGAPLDPAALPSEWDEWAEEPGQRVSLQENGSTLGTLHVVMVGRDEAWLEGLWVHASARGRGIGHRLVEEAEAVARSYGATIVRTAVPAHNDAALAVAGRAGFARSGEAVVAVADIASGSTMVRDDLGVATARPADVPAIIGLLGASDRLSAWGGLIPLGWRFRAIRPELVRGLVKDGRILRTGDAADGVVTFAVRGRAAVIACLSGPREHRQALYGAVVGRARGAGSIVMFAPAADGWDGIRASFVPHPWCPDGLVLVERRLGVGSSH